MAYHTYNTPEANYVPKPSNKKTLPKKEDSLLFIWPHNKSRQRLAQMSRSRSHNSFEVVCRSINAMI